MRIPEDHFCYNNPLMRESIDILELPNRAANALRSDNLLLIGHVMFLNDKTILGVVNMGIKSADHVKEGLARLGLELGVVTPPHHHIHEYHAIDVEDFYALDSEIKITVSVPAPSVTGKSDEQILAAIQGACQHAFDMAVVHKLNDVVLNFAEACGLDVAPISVEEACAEQIGFPTFDIREVEVSLQCHSSLSAVFKNHALKKVAESLAGRALYPELKDILDGLSAEPS